MSIYSSMFIYSREECKIFCSNYNQFFEQLQDDLKLLEIPFIVNPHLVRGLDYYDNLVFEFTSKAGAVIV